MLTFYRSGGILIPLTYSEEPWFDSIKRFLTRYHRDFHTKEIVSKQFFIITNKFMIIPRYFPIQDFVKCKVIDKTNDGEDISIDHNIKPKNDLQKRTIDYLKNNDSATIELQPGTGKTVIAIYDVAIRKKKTMVLVHRVGLLEQWRDRFLEHSNLNKDDILFLNKDNYHQMYDKKIILATNQGFLSLKQNIDFLKVLNESNIGILFSDEGHTTAGASSFSECSLHIPAKVTRALTATPYRPDGNSDIIEFHCGSIFNDESYEGTITNVHCTLVLVDYGLNQPHRRKWLYYNLQDFQWHNYFKVMSNPKQCPRFFNTVKGVIEKLQDRNVIVMCERNKLIDELYNKIKIEDKSKYNKSEKEDKLKNRITFSTPGKVRDGIDAPWKDSVVLTSPISNIKQMIGRVSREYNGKKDVKIIDIVDIGCWDIAQKSLFRLDYYKQNNWTIQFLAVSLDGKINKISEEEARQLIELNKGE